MFLGKVRVVVDVGSLVPTVVVIRGSLPEAETEATNCWIHCCWAGVKIGASLEEDGGTSKRRGGIHRKRHLKIHVRNYSRNSYCSMIYLLDN